MSRKNLILWGGGHLAETMSRLSDGFDFVDQLILVSRDPKSQALSRKSGIVVAKSISDLDHSLLVDAIVLATRPFSSWPEEKGRKNDLALLKDVKKLVMISSTGVYLEAPVGSEKSPDDEETSITVDEESAVKDDHSYIVAEKEISAQLPALIVRCAGLYDSDKGPHRYYLRNKSISGSASAFLNLIHYEDLGLILVKILKREFGGNELSHSIYNVSDGSALTRKEIHQHLVSWGASWSEIESPSGVSPGLNVSKIVATKIWRELKIQPKFSSFLSFSP